MVGEGTKYSTPALPPLLADGLPGKTLLLLLLLLYWRRRSLTQLSLTTSEDEEDEEEDEESAPPAISGEVGPSSSTTSPSSASPPIRMPPPFHHHHQPPPPPPHAHHGNIQQQPMHAPAWSVGGGGVPDAAAGMGYHDNAGGYVNDGGYWGGGSGSGSSGGAMGPGHESFRGAPPRTPRDGDAGKDIKDRRKRCVYGFTVVKRVRCGSCVVWLTSQRGSVSRAGRLCGTGWSAVTSP